MNSEIAIEDVLQREGVFVGTTSGNSMLPLFRDRKDTVIIKKVVNELKKYDVVLYRSNGNYVLHRILGKNNDGYIIRGDNCVDYEYGITDSDIIGVLCEFYRNDKHYNVTDKTYKVYSVLRCGMNKVISFLRKIRRRIKEKA